MGIRLRTRTQANHGSDNFGPKDRTPHGSVYPQGRGWVQTVCFSMRRLLHPVFAAHFRQQGRTRIKQAFLRL